MTLACSTAEEKKLSSPLRQVLLLWREAGGSGTAIGRQKFNFVSTAGFLELGVSPGGSGDLLAATLFLDAVDRKQEEVQTDRSGSENQDGPD